MSIKPKAFGKRTTGKSPSQPVRMPDLAATPAPHGLFGRGHNARAASGSLPSPSRIEQMVKPVNRVRLPRQLAYREVHVVYGNYTRAGIAMDYSEGGLRVRFPTTESLPALVYIHAPAIGVESDARVVWHKGMEYGFALIQD